MLKLYVYPGLFGLNDNNPFGLKVDTFMQLAGIDYTLVHTIDASVAPKKQLPFIVDGQITMAESNQILHYLSLKYQVRMDEHLSDAQKTQQYLITSLLDNHLYWVISYSRWQDDKYWPQFREAFLAEYADIGLKALDSAREYNKKKYYHQGIGRSTPAQVYDAGISDIICLKQQLGATPYMFGDKPTSLDASCYGFLANIYYYDISTPLKNKICEDACLVSYIERIKSRLTDKTIINFDEPRNIKNTFLADLYS
jgi:glutathione S-transferase